VGSGEFVHTCLDLLQKQRSVDRLEAAVFPGDRFAVVTLEAALEPSRTTRPFASKHESLSWFKEPYHASLEDLVTNGKESTEWTTAHVFDSRLGDASSPDWEIEQVWMKSAVTKSLWFRLLFGWTDSPTQRIADWLGMSSSGRRVLRDTYAITTVDLLLPLRVLAETLAYLQNTYAVYPMFVRFVRLPHRPSHKRALIRGGLQPSTLPGASHTQPYEWYFAISLNGVSARGSTAAASQELARFCIERNGYWMPRHQPVWEIQSPCGFHMEREDFERMFDHRLYQQCRSKYGANEAFPDAYSVLME